MERYESIGDTFVQLFWIHASGAIHALQPIAIGNTQRRKGIHHASEKTTRYLLHFLFNPAARPRMPPPSALVKQNVHDMQFFLITI